MKDRPKQKSEEQVLDILIGARPLFKPQRPLGRLPQLNKHFRNLKRYHTPVNSSA